MDAKDEIVILAMTLAYAIDTDKSEESCREVAFDLFKSVMRFRTNPDFDVKMRERFIGSAENYFLYE